MENLKSKYTVIDNIALDSDGYIGIPVKLSFLFDKDNFSVAPGYRKTPIIIYVINTNTERIGTESDEKIISRMLDRGYVVTLLDYMNSPLAKVPRLDLSVQGIRRRLMDGEFFEGCDVFPNGKYTETIVVPAGYDVSYNNVFWSFDKHGADGDLEKITEIWNNDFRGTKAEVLIKWTDSDGNRKNTQDGHDGSLPEWCDKYGTPSDCGEYIRVKHTKAEKITDCVKPDGTPIELNLYMHLIYPTNPEKDVPVMCLANSSEDLCSGSATADRPHLLGFLFRGYAGVMYDYGYTPMARLDSYGYFDGFPKSGYITGDNPTYSMQFYNDKRINTAAMRFIRYLSLTEDKIRLDRGAIGVYGNSKGAWMTFLGERDPEKMQSKRMHKGHHDETRYENGKTADEGIIRGGEEQPWLTCNGDKICGEANFVYSSCGGVDDAITAEHCPMFISANRRDGSCYSTSNAMMNVSRIYDVPTMYVDIPLPHTITYDNDLVYGFDTYEAFFDFIGYYLKGDAVKVLAAKFDKEHFPYTLTLKFSGGVSNDEIGKIKITNSNGEILNGSWNGVFSGVDWVFTPEIIEYGAEYELHVPESLVGKNGKKICDSFSYKFNAPDANITEISAEPEKDGLCVSFTKNFDAECHYIEFAAQSGANTLGIYTESGVRVGAVNIGSKGQYRADITDFVTALPFGSDTKLYLKSEFAKTEASHFDFIEDTRGGSLALYSIDKAPDGRAAVKISGFKTVTEFPTEEFYSYPARAFTCDSIIKAGPLSKSDLGRKFNISMKFFDTVSRYIRVELSHSTSREDSIADYNRNCYNIRTKAGVWDEISFDYTVYEPMYENIVLPIKQLIVSAYGHGCEEKPIYFTDIKSYEYISDLEISEINLVSCAKSFALPVGQSDIECKKSPWSKK